MPEASAAQQVQAVQPAQPVRQVQPGVRQARLVPPAPPVLQVPFLAPQARKVPPVQTRQLALRARKVLLARKALPAFKVHKAPKVLLAALLVCKVQLVQQALRLAPMARLVHKELPVPMDRLARMATPARKAMTALKVRLARPETTHSFSSRQRPILVSLAKFGTTLAC